MSARPDRQDLTVSTRVAWPSAVLATLCLALAGCTPAPGPAETSVPAGVPTKSPTPTPTVTIEPVLVVASVDTDGKHLTASGYVQGVIADGGACTFRFTRDGSADVTSSHDAVADRATTSCGTVQPDIGQFTRGTWHVTLTYASNGTDFVSQPLTVEVP
jgi:hypothetical protein